MYEDGDVTEYERFARARDGRDYCWRQAASCQQEAEQCGDRKIAAQLRRQARDWEATAKMYERSM